MSVVSLPELVEIPSAVFVMGNDDGREDERPAHRVALAAFRAAVAPVSNAEYARFVAETGYEAPPFGADARFSGPGQPAVGISWFDASAYCEWLAKETGVAVRLPTEAEREFAALGGLERADWPWGDGHHASAETVNAADGPHTPMEACANGYGLRCMAENVHEWCSDWYGAGYYALSPVEGPAGPPAGKRRASRGGAWRHKDKFTRVSARSSIPPEFRYSDYGFRVYVSVG